MPILQLSFQNQIETHEDESIDPVKRFSELAEIDERDVTLTVRHYHQIWGNSYACIVKVLIPDMWNQAGADSILKSVVQVIEEKWKIPSKEVLGIVHKLNSGHIIDNGKIVNWD